MNGIFCVGGTHNLYVKLKFKQQLLHRLNKPIGI